MKDVPHRRCLPLAAASCGDASAVQGDGDLTERLCAGGLGLPDGGHDCIGVGVGPCPAGGVGGVGARGHRLGEDCPASDLEPLQRPGRPWFGQR